MDEKQILLQRITSYLLLFLSSYHNHVRAKKKRKEEAVPSEEMNKF